MTVPEPAYELDVELSVNGEARRARVEARRSLAELLRDDLGLTGTHLGCEHGVCGSCTVLLDGEPVRSCLTLAVQATGRSVTTVEGLADGDRLHPVQQGCLECHSFQCGFCTPGRADDRGRAARRGARPRRGHDPRGAVGQPVPLHRLREHRRGRAAGRRAAEGGADGRPAHRHQRPAGRGPPHPHRPGPLRRRRHPARHAARRLRAQPVPARPGRRASTSPRRCAVPGVRAVLTAADLDGVATDLTPVGPPDLLLASFPALARDTVRLVGDPVAIVLADSRALAEDGAEMVEVDYDPLPGVGDMDDVLAGTTEAIFPELGTNVVHRATPPLRRHRRRLRRRRPGDHDPLRAAPPRQRAHGVPGHDRPPRPGHRHPRRARRPPVAPRPAPPPGRRARPARPRRAGALRRHRRLVRPEVRAHQRGRRRVRRLGAARPAGEVDRGPQREPHGRRPGARGARRRRGRGRRRGPAARRAPAAGARPGRLPASSATRPRATWRSCGPCSPRRTGSRTSTWSRWWCAPTRPPTCPTGGRGRSRRGCASGCSTPWPASSASSRSVVRERNLLRPDELPRESTTGVELQGFDPRRTFDDALALLDVPAFRARQAAARAEGRLLGLGLVNVVEPAPGHAQPHPGDGDHGGAPHGAGGPGPARARRLGHRVHQPDAPRPEPRDDPRPAGRRRARPDPRPGAGRARRHPAHPVQHGRHRRLAGRHPGQRRGGGRGLGGARAGAGRGLRADGDRARPTSSWSTARWWPGARPRCGGRSPRSAGWPRCGPAWPTPTGARASRRSAPTSPRRAPGRWPPTPARSRSTPRPGWCTSTATSWSATAAR